MERTQILQREAIEVAVNNMDRWPELGRTYRYDAPGFPVYRYLDVHYAALDFLRARCAIFWNRARWLALLRLFPARSGSFPGLS